jgi:hypothetical protein
VHEVADDEAQVAAFCVCCHLQATFGCVSKAVDFWEGHVDVFDLCEEVEAVRDEWFTWT